MIGRFRLTQCVNKRMVTIFQSGSLGERLGQHSQWSDHIGIGSGTVRGGYEIVGSGCGVGLRCIVGCFSRGGLMPDNGTHVIDEIQ